MSRTGFLSLLLTIAVAALPSMIPAAEVTMKGQPIALAGQPVSVGEKAPEFTALDAEFQPVSLDAFRGRPVLVSAVPSLDTPVCSLQTRRFHEALSRLPDDVVVITISMDLPFAQKRFCGQEDIRDMVVLSDSARREFGRAYGVAIPDRGLLARSVFVIDREGIVRYVQIVPEITEEPRYDDALAAVREIAG
jgi:thiol peroxidase